MKRKWHKGKRKSLLFRVQDRPWDTIWGLTHTFYWRHFWVYSSSTPTTGDDDDDDDDFYYNCHFYCHCCVHTIFNSFLSLTTWYPCTFPSGSDGEGVSCHVPLFCERWWILVQLICKYTPSKSHLSRDLWEPCFLCKNCISPQVTCLINLCLSPGFSHSLPPPPPPRTASHALSLSEASSLIGSLSGTAQGEGLRGAPPPQLSLLMCSSSYVFSVRVIIWFVWFLVCSPNCFVDQCYQNLREALHVIPSCWGSNTKFSAKVDLHASLQGKAREHTSTKLQKSPAGLPVRSNIINTQ